MILSGRYRPALMFLIALVLALIFVPQTQATLLVYESFDYTAGNNVKGQNGGLGFSGTWNYAYANAEPKVATGSLVYTNLPTAGNSAELTPSGGNHSQINRSLDSTYNSGTVYISLLATKNDGSRFFGLNLVQSGTLTGFLGQGGLATNWQYIAASGPRYSSTVSSTDGATSLLVLKIEFGAGTGGNDKISLFMNPTANIEPGSPSVSSTNIKIGSFNSVGLGAGWTNGVDQTTSIGKMDEIRIGTTFADVAPIPEPGTAAAVFFGVALMSFAIRRRRPSHS